MLLGLQVYYSILSGIITHTDVKTVLDNLDKIQQRLLRPHPLSLTQLLAV